MRNPINITGTDLGALGLVGCVIYGGIKLWQLRKVAKKLDMALEDIAEKTPIEIQQATVDKAIETAVNREVQPMVVSASRKVTDQIRSDMNRDIRAEVKARYDDISEKVTKEISAKVASIVDEKDLKRRIEDKAEELVVDKLDGTTDEALEKFNRGLGKYLKFYEGIGDLISGNRNNGNGFQVKFN